MQGVLCSGIFPFATLLTLQWFLLGSFFYSVVIVTIIWKLLFVGSDCNDNLRLFAQLYG